MHAESIQEMKEFADKYVGANAKVLDVGSLDINGSYRGLFGKGYVGLDIVPGPNVDLCVDDPYGWPLEIKSFDVVISGQAFEHIEFPEKTMLEISRVLKPGGYCCIIAPSAGPKHDYPKDYRRFDVKSLRQLAKDGSLKVISAVVNETPVWNDAVLIGQKPKK